jgi:Holliday junction resolvase RusA-like endonuclease
MVESSAKKLKPWRVNVAAIARRECVPIEGPVDVYLMFVLYRPKSTPKTKPTPPAIKKNGDIDKLTRAVLDGLTGPAYKDDCQVTALKVRKRIAELGEPTGCLIEVKPDRAEFYPVPIPMLQLAA